MLEVEHEGLTYHRALRKDLASDTISGLKNQFDYSFIVSFADFTDPSYHIISKNSCLITLQEDSEKLLAGFNPGNRNQIRKFERIDGFVFERGIGAFDEYFDFYTKCENERNWFPVPPAELKGSEIFSVRSRGKLITGMSCYGDAEYFRVGRIYSNRRSGVSEEISNQHYASASKKIVFEICKFAYGAGFRYVDLGGVDLEDPSKKGLAEFKMSFKPEVVGVKICRHFKPGIKEKIASYLSKGIDIT